MVPKAGERVMIVRGKHQGYVGKILDKDKKNDSLQVQLMNDEFQIVRDSSPSSHPPSPAAAARRPQTHPHTRPR